MNAILDLAEGLQRVAEVRAREVARQKRKRTIGNVIEWGCYSLSAVMVAAILCSALLAKVAPTVLAAALA